VSPVQSRPAGTASPAEARPDADAAGRCPACSGASSPVAEVPLDYEYGVVPARPFGFQACAACGSQWLVPRPDARELLSFYPDGYHAYHDDHGAVASALVALRARLRARQYRGMLPADGGFVFDVGAGDCRHFAELSRTPGIRFAGVEINPTMAARARTAGYDVEAGTLEAMDLGRHLGRYHVVSMNHVLEHVVDAREVARRAWRILRPGGRLVGQLPTLSTWEHRAFGARWAGYHFPRHLQLFSRAGLARLLEEAGFVDVRVRSTPHVQTALSVQNWLVSRGLRARLRFGRAPFFGALLALSLPVELVALLLDRSGVVDFEARRPLATEDRAA
jgi:SAM-dependent methyltransferase